MESTTVNVINEKFEFNFEGWDFKLDSFNEIQSSYKVIAKKDDLTEAMFVEPKYLSNKEDFIKECKRFYINCLDTLV